MAFGHATVLERCTGLQLVQKTGLSNLNASTRDTLLGGITARIKLGDGSHLNVVDNSDLTDFIRHHAWCEDEVALPREDRLCLFGNLTGRSRKRCRNGRSRLDPVASNVVVSFLVETVQNELEPVGTGANELEPRRDGNDDTASTRKPLAANQRKVIQNIHNNCGHPSREEFLRVLRLRRARPEVLSATCDESSSVWHVKRWDIL